MSFEIQFEKKLSESTDFVKKAIVQKLVMNDNSEKYLCEYPRISQSGRQTTSNT